jgi:hypothetical protein
MRIVGEFDVHRPAIVDAVLHLAADLLVGQVGEE